MTLENSTLGEPTLERSATGAVRLSLGEALGLARAAGHVPVAPSPLAGRDIEPVDPGPPARRALFAAGWLEGGERPTLTTLGRTATTLLAVPSRRVDLVLGTGTWWYEWTGLGDGSADRPVLTVSQDGDGSSLVLSAPHPPRQAVDLIAAHLRVGRISDRVPLDVELSSVGATTWSGVLDDRLDSNLRAMLDRTPVTREYFDGGDVFNALLEGRTTSNLAWQVAVDKMVWPEVIDRLDRDAVEAGLAELAEQELVEPNDRSSYGLTPPIRELIERLVPVARWARLTVVDRRERLSGGPDDLTVERLVFRRGVGSMTVESPSVTTGGLTIRSIDDGGLEMLLLALLSRPGADVATAGKVAVPLARVAVCASCGEQLRTSSRFCHVCGGAVTAEVGS